MLLYPQQYLATSGQSGVGDRVQVIYPKYSAIFNEDTPKGTIIRDDRQNPGGRLETIILMDDGRVFLGEECTYRPVNFGDPDFSKIQPLLENYPKHFFTGRDKTESDSIISKIVL